MHPSTLRAWERRYGLLRPERTAAGHRLYSVAEVERVRQVARLAGEGIPYPRIGDLLGSTAAPLTSPGGPEHEPQLRDALARQVFAFDSAGLQALYDRTVSVLPFQAAFERVFLPVLVQIGDRWESGEDVVAAEHLLSAFVRRKLLNYLNHLPLRPGRRVILAGAPGDYHEIGLLVLTLELAARGVPAVFLGNATPPEPLLRVAATLQSPVVCVSATLTPVSPDLLDLVGRLRGLPAAPQVLLGGRGTPALAGRVPEGVSVYGEDAGAGASHAQALAGAAAQRH